MIMQNLVFYIYRIPLFSIAIWYALTKYDFFSKKIIIFYIIFLSIIIIDSLIQFSFGKNISKSNRVIAVFLVKSLS